MGIPLAVGKVVNGQMTMVTKDGITTHQMKSKKPEITAVEDKKKSSDQEPPAEQQEEVNIMPWMQRYMDEKRIKIERQRAKEERQKTPLHKRIFRYIKEEFL